MAKQKRAPKPNALLDLAWAALSEEACVAKAAHECAVHRYAWRTGYKGEVREIVQKTRPVRGNKKARLEAVITTIPKIRELRDKRQGNPPIDWSKWKPESRAARRLAICRHLVQHANLSYNSCYALRQWHGHVIMVCSARWQHEELVIRHPGGRIDRIRVKGVRDNANTAIQEALAYICGKKTKEAILNNAFISYDFCGLRTIVHYPGGRVEKLNWPEQTKIDLAGKPDTRPPCKACS